MAHHFSDNVYTRAFTPREYQVELLSAAKERNIIVCLGNSTNKTFIALKLIQELAIDVRRCYKKGGKRTLFLAGSVSSVAQNSLIIKHLTDLNVGDFSAISQSLDMDDHQVLVMTSEVCLFHLQNETFTFSDINLLVIEECHRSLRDHPLQSIMEVLMQSSNLKPRILGLTAPLVPGPGGSEPGRLEAEIQQLECILNCRAETASDIVSVLRYCAKPKEMVVECRNYAGAELSEIIYDQIEPTLQFLEEHRYDPSEIYEDEFSEEITNIPDPKQDPFDIIRNFKHILKTMGPWCADKAAFVLLVQIEKLKVKTPYERHFLLLCLISSLLLKIRAICENALQTYEEKERIYIFSSPKILRLIEIIKQFKPKCQQTISQESTELECIKEEASVNSLSPEDISINAINNIENLNNKIGVCSNGSDGTDIHAKSKKIINNCEKIVHLINGNTFDEESSDNINSDNLSKVNSSDNNTSLNNKKPHCDTLVDEMVDCNSLSNQSNICNSSSNQPNICNGLPNQSNNCSNISSTKDLETYLDSNINKKCDTIPTELSLALTGSINKIDNITSNDDNKLFGRSINGLSKVGQGEEFGVRGGRWRGRGRGWRFQRKIHGRTGKNNSFDESENLCAIIFVENRFTAKILFHLLSELRKFDPDFEFLCPQYTVEKTADPVIESREAELEHRKQEEVLKRFRMRECNILIATSVLEEGIDLPKCNLVIRYDTPSHYRSYVNSKGRARAQDSHYILLVEESNLKSFVNDLAQFMEIEKMLLNRCTNREPSEEEEGEADLYTHCVTPYTPVPDEPTNVNMANAIALVNRYCAKLPSDTFTRLTPLWWIDTVLFNGSVHYVCTIKLPINSPVKKDIIGHPMPTQVLARRIAALEVCRVLHQTKELDDQLQPIGKEGFKALEITIEEEPESDVIESSQTGTLENLEPRPGTTKRRQYYYKRIASSLSGCRPVPNEPAKLYQIKMVLTCPLPEEQNTRGRKLHPPEEATQGFGILTLKDIPKICPFPIFTRSGEVRVSLELRKEELLLNEKQLNNIATFLNYTFTSVLRLQKYLMMFDPNASENSYLIVPTKKTNNESVDVDWEFLELIYLHKDDMPHLIPDEDRADFTFDPLKYPDAVVMPWYRNQDQPQYFYVAEICTHLNPKSSFPGSDYKTFEEYYLKKYGIQVQNNQQPLLDVDHTSARLNFLTPRYVNRKGVALPTSSEETKRAKRENLEQKQILVPELCMIHPFPASLWRQAVSLPCVLYRINALLLADEIRTTVAKEIGLGLLTLPQEFEWRPLDFGWSLADVLRKSKEENEKAAVALRVKNTPKIIEIDDNNMEIKDEDSAVVEEKSIVTNDMSKDDSDSGWMEIGTWSNDMAGEENFFDSCGESNLNGTMVRYGSPTSWLMDKNSQNARDLCYYDSDVTSSSSSELGDELSSQSDDSSGIGQGLRITFKNDYLAEAIDYDPEDDVTSSEEADWQWDQDSLNSLEKEVNFEIERFKIATAKHEEHIMSNGMVVLHDRDFILNRESSKPASGNKSEQLQLDFTLEGYALPKELNMELNLNKGESYMSNGIDCEYSRIHFEDDNLDESLFSFDKQPDLMNHPGPSPSVLLQALTMSNANDGINLERLETIGDSFLKYAITTFLYCTYETVHEGKLSHLRSKQVSNLNLYRLGKRKVFGESMIATKFEPHDNWLPPCYLVPKELERALIEAGLPACQWNQADLPGLRDLSRDEINAIVKERGEQLAGGLEDITYEEIPCFVPYNLITQHSIPDKSIADCVEALIGAYLIDCGPRGALLFMSWLGIRVLPLEKVTDESKSNQRIENIPSDSHTQVCYGFLKSPQSPLLRHVPNAECQLNILLDGFDVFERNLRYHFQDRSYLLQAMTHASYSPNRLTDCYQRLEFLGDAVLDYLITRHLYEDKRQHCPGALTDLRSALVNNTIFASLAVRHGFHKFFRHFSPGLAEVVERFVRIQEENSHAISEEYYLIGEEECEEAEDVEVPKALGDVFESVAGAVFLDSNMSLDAVWRVYYRMMKTEIEQFSNNVPKSPIRELLEMEPETAKFGKPEKLADGRRVRVTVEVFGKGVFKGIGRNYRIAKCTAAKCALKQLKKRGLLMRKANGGQKW
uniref:ribonuclease III n=1 Tax=Clastoptera arizonana TaxID=38151 RepID=A0A1B6DKN5_9HEMI